MLIVGVFVVSFSVVKIEVLVEGITVVILVVVVVVVVVGVVKVVKKL